MRPICGLLLAAALAGCTAVSPVDREKIRRVSVVQNQEPIVAKFNLPTDFISAVLSEGVSGILSGAISIPALTYGLSCVEPISCAATVGTGAILGGVVGLFSGAACRAAVMESEVQDPANELRRLVENTDKTKFTHSLESRLQQLRPIASDSLFTLGPDTLLKITGLSINMERAKPKAGDASRCHPSLAGYATWRALRAADGSLLIDKTTSRFRRTSTASFKDWFATEATAHLDIALLLDDIGVAIAEELLTGKVESGSAIGR